MSDKGSSELLGSFFWFQLCQMWMRLITLEGCKVTSTSVNENCRALLRKWFVKKEWEWVTGTSAPCLQVTPQTQNIHRKLARRREFITANETNNRGRLTLYLHLYHETGLSRMAILGFTNFAWDRDSQGWKRTPPSRHKATEMWMIWSQLITACVKVLSRIFSTASGMPQQKQKDAATVPRLTSYHTSLRWSIPPNSGRAL